MTESRYRYNVMDVNSLLAFARVRGGFHNDCHDVYFIVLQGADETLKQDMDSTDRMLTTAMEQQQLVYKRVSCLPGLSLQEEIEYYSRHYDEWSKSDKHSLKIKVSESNPVLAEWLGGAVEDVTERYADGRKGISDSIKKNFAVKLMYWIDALFASDCSRWTDKTCVKVIAENVSKEAESYFYYMLTRMGADVLLLQLNRDMELPNALKQVSKRVILGGYAAWRLPEYVPPSLEAAGMEMRRGVPPKEAAPEENGGERRVLVHLPEHSRRKKRSHVGTTSAGSSYTVGGRQAVQPVLEMDSHTYQSREKSFEQLALLARSVVMIAIHNDSGDIVGSGSGIMVGADGFILTNYHVVRGGSFFSVSIEEDETVYPTDEIIKYNNVLDLAIIRIQKQLSPIPVYKGREELVRGQKVVAIGSPLGLFNSVSDGIISGFRVIDGVDMIQFTAPISHGSSGGAVLNMYGEIIGISTAGFDSGQNINLAVRYDQINAFIQGFIR